MNEIVKNLFKKGKLREDIFQSVAVFEKYQILEIQTNPRYSDKCI